ncbi:hypothetical protein BN11_430021 [Nostocoides australiense Ben110]|uniref:Uncharacterized protein n=1 Tax=Nostocoides australiense Ben110 TaxID=1193182 RepID=W6K020_9MICO|nr:hypothetical protein BN11_430021 [Tetrasphaera australiensis Ben110]
MLIDRQLADAGWSVQDKTNLNLFASDGVACREVVMKAGHGRADYLLYVDRKVVGVTQAKPEGTTLSGGCADEDSENGIFDLNCPSGEWPEPCTRADLDAEGAGLAADDLSEASCPRAG